MKKIISTLLVVVVLFNFIFCSGSYATEFQGTDSLTEDSITTEDQESIVNSGEIKNDIMGPIKLKWTIIGGIFGTIAGILAIVANLFPMLVQVCMTAVTGVNGLFTIENTVFNEIGLFNINYFNYNDTYEVGTGDYAKTISTKSSLILKVKESIAKFYMILRLIAVALSLLILIYVGIRMALSTISSDKARYKEMLIGWVESVVILFLMQYIISLIINIGELFGNMIYNIKCVLDTSAEMSFEITTMNKLISNMLGNAGWNYVANSVAYWFLVFVQTKFFLAYFKRVVTVGFLILIAPIITVTYPIDKIGDGKAQAFSVWFSELSINVFIQPIHALIYLVFMYSAGEIAKYSIFVAILFLLALTKVEKIVLQLFNLKNIASLAPVSEQRTKKG